MKRFVYLVAVALTFFVICYFVSCEDGKVYGSKKYKVVEVTNGGNAKGNVLFKGASIPEPEKYQVTKEEFVQHCGKEVETETLLVNKNNKGIKNVVVYIDKIKEGKNFDNSLKEAILDQRGYIFKPHIVLIAQNGTLTIKNSDKTLHNVHFLCKMNEGINEVQPANTVLKRELIFKERIDVKCGIHSWMSAYIFVVDHPYYVVTDENGAYELKDIPAGKYIIKVWHEKLGEKTSEITVEPGKTLDLNFELEGK